jgi:hypothetical protein
LTKFRLLALSRNGIGADADALSKLQGRIFEIASEKVVRLPATIGKTE